MKTIARVAIETTVFTALLLGTGANWYVPLKGAKRDHKGKHKEGNPSWMVNGRFNIQYLNSNLSIIYC